MRLTRKFSDVVNEVRLILQSDFGVDSKAISVLRKRVDGNGHQFPTGTHFVDFDTQWLDYEVQRAAIPNHILTIMRTFDPRLCGPASACQVDGYPNIVDPDITTIYDGQQRSIAMAILGYPAGPCTVVVTNDPAFPSYAFEMLNETGVKKLTPGDLHRNALTRWKLGSHDIRNARARTLQDQFDALGIDLQDKNARKSPTQCGINEHFFSHFKYAYKGIDIDNSGRILFEILDAILYAFPDQEEIDQGVFIGLYELARIGSTQKLPARWMRKVLKAVSTIYSSSDLVHAKAKLQWAHINPGATWSAPSAMSNFLREVYMIADGKIVLPYHGEGAKMQVATNPVRGLMPRGVLAKRKAA